MRRPPISRNLRGQRQPDADRHGHGAGARSQVAQLVFAGIVLLVLLFLAGPLQFLPRCVLASIVFTIALGIIDVPGLRDVLRESPGEFRLAALTAVAVVAIGVEQGILMAIALSCSGTCATAIVPTLPCARHRCEGRREPVRRPRRHPDPGPSHRLSLRADLYYANSTA